MQPVLRRRRTAYGGPACPGCGVSLDLDRVANGQNRCVKCNVPFEAARFDPPLRPLRVLEMPAAGPDGATPCAKHLRNVAETSCGRCGIFICSLCRIDVEEKVLCPGCFERLRSEGGLESVQTRFKDYGGMARTAVIAGVFLWPAAVAFGIAAILYGIRGLREKKKRGELDGILGIWLAMGFGVLEIIGEMFLAFAIAGAFS